MQDTEINWNLAQFQVMCKPVLGFVILVLASLYIVYQLVFHPLAEYPGPFLAKFSIARATYYAWKGDGHLDIWQLHRKYGPIVRYGPNWLLFNSVEGYKDIYSTTQNTGKHAHFSQFNPRASNLFTIHDKQVHSQRRRCIGRAFSDASVKLFQDKLLCHIGTFCDKIDQLQDSHGGLWGSPLKMSDWAAYFIFDTLTDFLFGQDYNLLGSTRDRHIIQHIRAHIIRPAVCAYMPMLAFFRIDKLLFQPAVESTRVFWRWVKNAIARRSQEVERRPRDVFTQIQLSRCTDPNSTTGVQSETGMLIVAGLDTTATALCALLFYLSNSHCAYDRLCSEIRSKFTAEHEIRLGQEINSCVYLRACIDEALRMSPPVASPPWREIGVGGEMVAGHAIPQGCTVGTGIYSMHHNDTLFESPHEFRPERWLSDQEIPQDKTSKPGFMPFSSGPRACIGKSLAYTELSLTMTTLLWRYDFRACRGQGQDLGAGKEVRGKERVGRENPGEFQLKDWVMGHHEGPVLQFRRREMSGN